MSQGRKRRGGDPDQVTGREALDAIERRLGGLLGSLAETLGKVADAAEAPPGADAGSPARTRTSVSIRVGGLAAGAGPAPQGRPPGRTTAGPDRDGDAPADAAIRHEVHEDATGWSLIAELPGAGPEDLGLTLEDGRLRIEVCGSRPRRLEVEAPARLALAALEVRLVNGILELRLPPDGAEGGA